MFEAIFGQQLRPLLEAQYGPEQHGFRKGHSTPLYVIVSSNFEDGKPHLRLMNNIIGTCNFLIRVDPGEKKNELQF